jgi:hypothetical protein
MSQIISVKSNIDELIKKYSVRDSKIPNAIKNALNKTGAKLKTQTDKFVRSNLAIKKEFVSPRIKPKSALIDRLVYELRVSNKPFHVMRFKGVRQTKKGISYKHDPKESKRLIRGAFIENARGRSNPLALRRKTKRRYPLRRLVRTSVHDVVKNHDYSTLINKLARDDFSNQLTKQLERFMD